MFISSTASRAERPLSGAPAAWEATTGKLILCLDTGVAGTGSNLIHIAGCQVRAASHSANTPSLAINAFVAEPSSPGQRRGSLYRFPHLFLPDIFIAKPQPWNPRLRGYGRSRGRFRLRQALFWSLIQRIWKDLSEHHTFGQNTDHRLSGTVGSVECSLNVVKGMFDSKSFFF